MIEKKNEVLRNSLYEAFCNGGRKSFAEALEKVIETQPEYYEKVKTNMLHSAAWLRLKDIFDFLAVYQGISEEDKKYIWKKFE